MSLKKRSSWQVQKAVWYALFLRELRSKVGEHILGPLWLVVEPLIHIATLTIIFSFVRERGDFQGVPFAAFFAAGILPFFIFQNVINKSLLSIKQNRQLFSYRQVKQYDPVTAMTLVELVTHGSILLILIWVGAWFFDLDVIPQRPLEVFAVLILICLMTLGLGLFCAVIGARWEDIGSIAVKMPIRLLYFISGILIPLQELPSSLHKYLLWNPMLHGIEQIRVYTFAGYSSPGTSISYLALWTIFSLVIGMAYFAVNRSRILLLLR